MTKKKFLSKLKKRIPRSHRHNRDSIIAFYSEMIDDKIEEGLTEQEAVYDVGTVEDAISRLVSEHPESDPTQIKPEIYRPLRPFEILLIVLGSPVWISILLVSFAVILTFYLVSWTVTLCLWCVELVFFLFSILSKYMLIACKKMTAVSVFLTRKTAVWLGKIFRR